jgi:cell division protein FtsL
VTPPAAAASPRARVSAPPRPRVSPPRPRRVSGPARQPSRGAAPASTAPPREERGLALGVLDALAGVTRGGALDRLIRGRIWIAVIAFALIGIVTLQLLVLQLNASIGRTLVRESQLERENAALSIEGSELASGERVESDAARLGMQLVPVGSLRFLRADPQPDIVRAAASLNTPVHNAGSSSAETGTAAATTAASATATATSTATSEQTPSETSAAASGEPAAASAATETGPSAGTPSAASTPTGAAASAPTTPTTASPSEAATAAAVGGAGGVGATQTNGAG